MEWELLKADEDEACLSFGVHDRRLYKAMIHESRALGTSLLNLESMAFSAFVGERAIKIIEGILGLAPETILRRVLTSVGSL